MRYGPIVAKRWKKQYYKRNTWNIIGGFEPQPQEIYIILLELKSKTAINALVGPSWTKRLPVAKKRRYHRHNFKRVNMDYRCSCGKYTF
jgi:hypothetical protein